MLSNGSNKINDRFQLYYLKQLINEEIHFTEHSASLIDLIMTRNSNSVLLSGVLDPFIPDQIRYHCPIILLLKFTRPLLRAYSQNIWNYSRADFDKYRELLMEFHLENAAEQNEIENSMQIVQPAIFEAAEKSIPNKTVIKRQNDHLWISYRIKSLIRKRKRLYKKDKQLRKTFSKFYRRHYELVSKFNVGFKNTFASRPIGTGILW